MIKKIIVVALVFCMLTPLISTAFYDDINNARGDDIHAMGDMENHKCLVLGIGYFIDLSSVGHRIVNFTLFILEHFIYITDVVLWTVLVIYLFISNILPGMKIPHQKFMVTYYSAGYVWAYGKEEKWMVSSEGDEGPFAMGMRNFTGIWLQLPIIINPIKYPPICMDVFAGYADDIYIWRE